MQGVFEKVADVFCTGVTVDVGGVARPLRAGRVVMVDWRIWACCMYHTPDCQWHCCWYMLEDARRIAMAIYDALFAVLTDATVRAMRGCFQGAHH